MAEFDTSKLENTGWRFFRDQMKEYYHHEFKELSNEYKDKAIEIGKLTVKNTIKV